MSAALAGKVALVTGAARGIGRAGARKLAREGCDVAANYYNSADEAETLCADIRALGRRAVAIPGSGLRHGGSHLSQPGRRPAIGGLARRLSGGIASHATTVF